MIHRITELVDVPRRDCIYDVLGHLDLRLCVDVGAAAGQTARRIREAGGPGTRVVAFEPFPGNHRFFAEATRGLDNVQLIKKAVGSGVGLAEFTVPTVVDGTEAGWERFVGYSSLGFLSSAVGSRRIGIKGHAAWAMRTIANRLRRRPPPRRLKVETTSMDAMFAGQDVDFMKIDVQGGEREVLRGSDAMLRRRHIKILYIEWSGDPQVVDALTERDYRLYDSTYVAGPRVYKVEAFEKIGFTLIDELRLSTGKVAYELLLTDPQVSAIEAIGRVRQRGLGWIQTDLIAVSPDTIDTFLDAARRYSASARPAPPLTRGPA